MINRVFCSVGEKNGVKYLSIDKADVLTIWNQVFSGIKYHIEKICGEKVNYDSDFDKIKFVSKDLLQLSNLIYFPTLTVVIRCFKTRRYFLSSTLFR